MGVESGARRGLRRVGFWVLGVAYLALAVTVGAAEYRLPIAPLTGEETPGNWSQYAVSSKALDGSRKVVTVWLLVKGVADDQVTMQLVEVPGYQEDWRIPEPLPEGSRVFDVAVPVGEPVPYVQLHAGVPLTLRYVREAETTLADGGRVNWRALSFEYTVEEAGESVYYRLNVWVNPQYAFGGLPKLEVMRRLPDGRYSSEVWEHLAQAPTAIVAETAAPTYRSHEVAATPAPTSAGPATRNPTPMPAVTGRERPGQWVKYRYQTTVLGYKFDTARWLVVTAVHPDRVAFRDIYVPWVEGDAIPQEIPADGKSTPVTVAVGEPYPLMPEIPGEQPVAADPAPTSVLVDGRMLPVTRTAYSWGEGDTAGSYVYDLAAGVLFTGVVRYERRSPNVSLDMLYVSQSEPFAALSAQKPATLSGNPFAGSLAAHAERIKREQAANPDAGPALSLPPRDGATQPAPESQAVPTPQAQQPAWMPREPEAADLRGIGVVPPPPAPARAAVLTHVRRTIAAVDAMPENDRTRQISRIRLADQMIELAAYSLNADELAVLHAGLYRGATAEQAANGWVRAVVGAGDAGRLDTLIDLARSGRCAPSSITYQTTYSAFGAAYPDTVARHALHYLVSSAESEVSALNRVQDFGESLCRRGQVRVAAELYDQLRPMDRNEDFVAALLAAAVEADQPALAQRCFDELMAVVADSGNWQAGAHAAQLMEALLRLPPSSDYSTRGLAAVDALHAAKPLRERQLQLRIALAARHGDLETYRRLLTPDPALGDHGAIASQVRILADRDLATAIAMADLIPPGSEYGIILRAGLAEAMPRGSSLARTRLQAIEPQAVAFDTDAAITRKAGMHPVIAAYLHHGMRADAERAAHRITDPRKRQDEIARIIHAAIAAGDHPQALRLGRRDNNPDAPLIAGSELIEALLDDPQALPHLQAVATLFVGGGVQERLDLIDAYLGADRLDDAATVARSFTTDEINHMRLSGAVVMACLVGRQDGWPAAHDYLLARYQYERRRATVKVAPDGYGFLEGAAIDIKLGMRDERDNRLQDHSALLLIQIYAGLAAHQARGGESPDALPALIQTLPDPEAQAYAYLGLARHEAR